MCFDPISLGMMALAGAGSAISSNQQNRYINQQRDTQNALVMQEMNRQRQFQREAADQFGETMARFAPAEQEASLEGAQEQLAGKLDANISEAPTSSISAPASTPQVVRDAMERGVTGGVDRARDQARRRAMLEGYDHNFFGHNLFLNDQGRRLDTIRDLSGTSASMLPTRMALASNTIAPPNTGLGDILSSVGRIGAFGAGRGWFSPGTPVPGHSPILPDPRMGALY